MKKFIVALLLGLLAFPVQAFNVRTLTGAFINAGGGAAITSGYIAVTAVGGVPATVPNGVLVPLPPYTFPIINGVLSCTSGCKIVAPANYNWQFYDTSSTPAVKVWSFMAGVPDVSSAVTVQEIYASQYVEPNPPATIVTVSGGPQGPVGPVGLQGPSGSNTPGGSSGEIQYNSSNAIAGFTGSSVSGANVTFPGTVTATGGFSGNLTGRADTATTATSAATATTAGSATTATSATDATNAAHVEITSQTDANGYYLTFVNATSGNAALGVGPGLTYVPSTGTLSATAFSGSFSGNADTVTNGLYSTGSYSDPAWLASLAGSKITGNISGNAATATLATTATLAVNATSAATATVAQQTEVAPATDAATYYPMFASTTSGASPPYANSGLTYVPSTGTLSATVFSGAFTGNASTVTNGVYTTGSYSNPAWITALSGTKITGDISGNAGTVTSGVYTTGSYSNPSWLTSLSGTKISGDIAGNAGTVTNGLYSTSFYADPSWITALSGTKITGDISGQAGSVANGLYSTGSYSDPAWLTSLAGSKISGNITGNAGTATAFASVPSACISGQFTTSIEANGNSNCAQVAFSVLSGTATWSQVSKSGALISDLGSGAATNGYVPIADGNGGINWGAQTGGGGGNFSAPAGTGLMHVTSSVMDGTAHLLVNADVANAAAIAWSKIDKGGAGPSDVGAASAAQGITSASGTAPLNLSFGSNAVTGSVDGATTGARGVVKLAGDLGGTADSPTVALVGGATAANVSTATAATLAATSSNTLSTIVARDSSGNFAAGTINADVTGNAGTVTNGVYTSRQVLAGSGLSGGGALSGDVTLSLASPVTVAHGGAGVNLSATGPGFMRQATTGANVTVLPLATTDFPASGTWTLTGNLNLTGNNIGIGVASPSHTLDVGGDLGMQTLPVNTAPGTGQVWGITITGQTAGEALAQGAVAYLNGDGKWYKADPTDAAKSGPVALGICPSAIGNGSTGTILIQGTLQINSWSLTVGGLYYLDPGAAGGFTTTPSLTTGQSIRAVGNALSATVFYFHPSIDWGTAQ